MLVSECCGSIPWNDTDICAECKEHADFIAWSDEGDNNDSTN